PDADENLAAEGVDPARVTRVGNIMMDSFELIRDKIEAEDSAGKFGLAPKSYGVVTFHRPSNVDDRAILEEIVNQLVAASERLPLVFPVHPRTRKQLQETGLMAKLEAATNIRLEEPISYRPFMSLMSEAKLVVTDSGGLQEETTYLGIPCMTLRENTERPITISQGTNKLVKPADLLTHIEDVMNKRWPTGQCPEFWDGKTAQRIVEDLRRRSA
ncbi:MAG: UDP-N-acetylglucosamine 2-epimerase, partial [Pseudomonadota bacterium]